MQEFDAKGLRINRDKAGRGHWDNTERNLATKVEVFAPKSGLRGFARRAWHEELLADLAAMAGPSAELMELGCGGSAFLPYFANQLKFQVSGIDYSATGLEIARQACEAQGVTPSLYCGNILDVPGECRDRYDVVVSFGLLEHFTDTDATVAAFAKFLRPGGRILTVIPNMQGVCGLGQRMLAPEVFRLHEVITAEELADAHSRVGLTVRKSCYFLFTNFGVINPGNRPGLVKSLLFSGLRGATALTWALESAVGRLKPNHFSSPYIICVADKPSDGIGPLPRDTMAP